MGALRQPLICNDGDHAILLYMGIIDYLQQWNSAKKVAKCIKTLECNKATIPPKPYGTRFYKHMTNIFTNTAENLQDKASKSDDRGLVSCFLAFLCGKAKLADS